MNQFSLDFVNLQKTSPKGTKVIVCCLPTFLLLALCAIIASIVQFHQHNDFLSVQQNFTEDAADYNQNTVPLLQQTSVEYFSSTWGNEGVVLPLQNTTVSVNGTSSSATSYFFEKEKIYISSNNRVLRVNSTELNLLSLGGESASEAEQLQLTTTITFNLSGTSPQYKVVLPRPTCDLTKGCSSSYMKAKCITQLQQNVAEATPGSDEAVLCDISEIRTLGESYSHHSSSSCVYYVYTPYYCQQMTLVEKIAPEYASTSSSSASATEPGVSSGGDSSVSGVVPSPTTPSTKPPMKSWQETPGVVGCDYPFQTQLRKCSARTSGFSEIPAKLLASNDPHVELSRLTKGTLSFGLTKEEQRFLAFALLALAGICLVLFLLLCFCMRSLCFSHNQRQAVTAAVFPKYVNSPEDNGDDAPLHDHSKPGYTSV